jgi:hypothetical protein
VARVAAFVGIAVGVSLLAVILLFVGSSLFLAEWLLGSMGWGVLHGVLLLTAIAVACGLGAVGVSGARIGRAFLVGLLVAIGVAVLLTLALPNRLYTSIGDAAMPGIEPGIRPLIVGAAIFAILGLIAGLVGAVRASGTGARVGALIGGIVFGALVGAVTAVNTGLQVALGTGIAVGYLTWIGLMGLDVARTGVDFEALKARFLPTQTIETSKETLAWLKSKMPPGTES